METKKENNWEEIFDQLVEDISHFKCSILEWQQNIGENSDTYLWLELVTRRFRSLYFLQLIKDCPKDYDVYKTKLHSEFNISNNLFEEYVKNNNRLNVIIQESLPQIMSFLEETLEKIISFYEDSILLDNDDILDNEFEFLADEFLTFLSQVYYIINSPNDIIPAVLSIEHIKTKFKDLEDESKKVFYYFAPISKKLTVIREQHLPTEGEWWYLNDPHTFEEKIEPFRIDIRRTEKTSSCYSPECLAYYAFNDVLTQTERQKMEKHILNCGYCYNEILDLKEVEDEVNKEKVWRPLPFSLSVELLMQKGIKTLDNVKTKILETLSSISYDMSINSLWPSTTSGSSSNEIKLKTFYDKEVYQDDNGRIILLDSPSRETNNNLKSLSEFFNSKKFYYRIYAVTHDGKFLLTKEDKDENFPIDIKIESDINFLLVVLGQEKETLNNNSELLIKLLDGQEVKTTGIVCLFVHIKPRE